MMTKKSIFPSAPNWLRFIFASILLLLLALPRQSHATGNLDPLGYGENIDEALINPTEPGKTEEDLTEQVAGILHSVKMDGGRTVRWFVSDVWPQYRCARDPEDQSNGELDPAWFTISRILLQQAQKEGISVVIVMADTANGTFAGLPSSEDKRSATVSGWKQYRQTHLVLSGAAASPAPCEQSFQNGYFGSVQPEAIFEDATRSAHLTNRFFRMAEYLKSFPALGALEMFNEPNFVETQKPEFGRTIARIRGALYARDPSLRKIPIYSGVAYWNEKVAHSLDAAGDLAEEPYINVHEYTKASVDPQVVTTGVVNLIAYLRRIVPGKKVIIAEAGSDASIHDLQVHANLFYAFLAARAMGHAGMWMWGTYANDTIPQPDFRWEFNSTALSGGAFRKLLVAADHEDEYRQGKPVTFTAAAQRKEHKELVTISQIPSEDANPQWRLRWQVNVGAERFISVSRAGILMRVASTYKDVFAEPGSVVAIDVAGNKRQWAEISPTGSDWQIKIYQCDGATSSQSAIPTPPYVIDYAGQLGNKTFKTCRQSLLSDSGML
ncbi:hypothetical protein ACFONN_19425 [Dyella humi]|uniref:Cellulase (Glycosyl hydrolase family 5) n=1 Tax=Dyella humi TaxID=1770547 RepID=A0ABW8IFK5_9GAMM